MAQWLFTETAGVGVEDIRRVNRGVLTNGAFWQGEGIKFDGSNDYISVGDTPSLRITTAEISLLAWMYDDASSLTGAFCGKVVSSHNYVLSIDDAGQIISFDLNTSAGRVTLDKPGGGGGLDFMHNRWNLVAGVYNGAAMQIYVNGVAIGASAAQTGTMVGVTDGFAIGAKGTGAALPYNGLLRGVSVYNRALTQAELLQLYTLPYSHIARGGIRYAPAVAVGPSPNVNAPIRTGYQ
jgi:hypothetical protein